MWMTFFKPEIGKPMTIYRQYSDFPENDEVRHTTKVVKIRHLPFTYRYKCVTESGRTYRIIYMKKINKLLHELYAD